MSFLTWHYANVVSPNSNLCTFLHILLANLSRLLNCHPESGGEYGDEGVDLAQPHRDQPEEDGADHRGEEAAPVVPHREEYSCDLRR